MESGGVDLIWVVQTARRRNMGFGNDVNVDVCETNALNFEYGTKEVLRVVKNTPVMIAVNSLDLSYDIEAYLRRLSEAGFSAVANFPTLALIPRSGGIITRRMLEDSGNPFELELNMYRLANKMDFLTLGYAQDLDIIQELARANVDIIAPHMGYTVHPDPSHAASGFGAKKGLEIRTLEEAAKKTNELIEAAKAIKHDALFLCHGGPIATPKDVRYMIDHTECVGSVAGIIADQVPIEKAIFSMAQSFKNG
jgi:predicted TIM-barrel enzyme